jgi:Flp pilus assembly protein TadD
VQKCTLLLLIGTIASLQSSAGFVAAQSLDPRQRILNQRRDSVALLGAWADAVRDHVPGQFDAPASMAARWSIQQLADLEIELNNLLVLMDDPNAKAFTAEDRQFRSSDVLYSYGELDRLRRLAVALGGRDPLNRDRDPAEGPRVAAARVRLIKRSAILHTDVARLAERQPDANAVGSNVSDRGVVHFYDGELLGVDRSGDHWEFARRLLDRVRPAQTRDPDVLQWYRSTLGWMLGALQLQWPQFQRAQELYPDDPELLYLRGYLHETLASPRVQNVAQAIAASGRSARVRAARAELRDAESYFRRALTANPQLADARLRLGRVQALLGNDAAAIRELQAALTATNDPVRRYYANLFLGSALESLGRGGEAREAYTRAAGYFPNADAPRFALSHLAVQSANATDAYAWLEVSLRREGGSDQDDPWWTYPSDIRRTAVTSLDAAYRALAGSGAR